MPAQILKLLPFIFFQKINKEHILIVNPKQASLACYILKNHFLLQFTILSCVSGIDFLGAKHRFCVAYDLLSYRFASRIRLKIFTANVPMLDSLTGVFTNANWWEREVWDMFGIFFKQHPDLRRILTDYGFEGYPLRKDFPLTGYVELRYDALKKK